MSSEAVDGPNPDVVRPRAGRHRREVAAPRRGSGVRIAAIVCAALCVPTAGADAYLGFRLRHDDRVEAARTHALAAARQSIADILSYDYRTLSKDIAKATGDTTGKFRAEYTSTAAKLLAEARPLKAIVQASVGAVSVEHASADRVLVLAFVDQASVKQLSPSAAPTTRIDQSRVRVTLSLVHGRWLVSELAAL